MNRRSEPHDQQACNRLAASKIKQAGSSEFL
jgi:hypothetical protein